MSTCSNANGTAAGANAFNARCSITIESLPPENKITGRSNSPATSRKMCTASDSNASRCVSAYGLSVAPPCATVAVIPPVPSPQEARARPPRTARPCEPCVSHPQIRVPRNLIRVVHPRQPRQLTRRLPRVQPLHITHRTHIHRRGHMHLHITRAPHLMTPTHRLTTVRVRRDHRHQHQHPLRSQQFGDKPDPLHIRIPILTTEPQPRGQELTDLVTVQHLHPAAPRTQPLSQRTRDRWSCPHSANPSATPWHPHPPPDASLPPAAA